MHSGFLNLMEKIAGNSRLYHCRWCRLQFYDRRPLATAAKTEEATATGPAQ
jgi:hypothetical protein